MASKYKLLVNDNKFEITNLTRKKVVSCGQDPGFRNAESGETEHASLQDLLAYIGTNTSLKTYKFIAKQLNP